MTDPRSAGGGHPRMGGGEEPGQPSQEEMQAYLEQLRDADVTEVLAQAFNMLATGANVKLGRNDARVAIDALDAMVGAVEARIESGVAEQMRTGVGQLQQAQVQAEQQAETPAAAAPDSDASEPSQEAGGQRMTDRLWLPGQEPGGT